MSKTTKQLQLHSWEIWKKEKYWSKNQVFDYLPVISGCPQIQVQHKRPYRARMFFSRQPYIKQKRMPKFCHIRKIINYPFKNWGAPQISFTGNYALVKA